MSPAILSDDGGERQRQRPPAVNGLYCGERTLAALGGAAPQLRFHIGAALKLGVGPAQLVETIAWVQYLAGMPAAYNALVELKRALAEGPDTPPDYQ